MNPAGQVPPGRGDFLAGTTLSLADIALVAYSRVANEAGFALDDYPALPPLDRPVERAAKIRD